MNDTWLQIGDKRLSRYWLDQHPDATQALLKKHQASRPLCLCQGEPGIPLYIAKKHSYYLARMPGSGSLHAPYCPSYELPKEHSGLRDYEKHTVMENADGTVHVNLAVPIGKIQRTSPHKLSTPSELDHQSQTTGINLLGLLHLLWERAALNRWSANMKGKRGYRTVHKYVLNAAQHITVKRSALIDHLYLPEPFNVQRKADIQANQSALIERLLRDPKGREQRMLVIGQVKQFKESPFGMGIVLKHASNRIFWLNQQRLHYFQKRYLSGEVVTTIALVNPLLWVIMSVEKSEKANYVIDNIAAMKTSSTFIPIDTRYDGLIADALVAQDRHFIKPLRYESHPNQVFPDFLLVDMGQTSVPLEIYGFSGNGKYEENKLKRIVDYKRHNERHWHWDVSQDSEHYPPFPRSSMPSFESDQ